MASWWASKARQSLTHLRASVAPGERAGLADWLTPAQRTMFEAMHVADQRHGLDVVAALRARDVDDPEILVAGLLHDAGKGATGIAPRIVYALGQRYGQWAWRTASVVPGFRVALRRLEQHAGTSAALAAAAGCSRRTVELIRRQDDPPASEASRLLHLADESS
ncbi:MAG: hypothetical protein H0U58_05555 [Chloroflexi bacterium]|nr:hypothetical protein [Chloroflexota bacterium]